MPDPGNDLYLFIYYFIYVILYYLIWLQVPLRVHVHCTPPSDSLLRLRNNLPGVPTNLPGLCSSRLVPVPLLGPVPDVQDCPCSELVSMTQWLPQHLLSSQA
jgi:hypothetical protein